MRRKQRWIQEHITELKDIEKIPMFPGCYVLYISQKTNTKYALCYIGSSTQNIRARIEHHIKLRLKNTLKPGKIYSVRETETLYFAKKAADKLNLNYDNCTFRIKYKITEKLGEELMREFRLIHRLKPPCNSWRKTRKEENCLWHNRPGGFHRI